LGIFPKASAIGRTHLLRFTSIQGLVFGRKRARKNSRHEARKLSYRIHNAGPLSFDLNDASGNSISDFIANTGGYYFAADILGSDGGTGMAGINTPGTPVPSVPEPGSLLLLATAAAGAFFVRRRLA